ncbi:hypothetical protein ACN38_g12756, partial [Penicillium nordicum]
WATAGLAPVPDPIPLCCDMRLVQIRNQAAPSELAPKCLYRRPS